MKPKFISTPVMEQSEAYFAAFKHLNECLFEGKLRAPMLVFTRNPAVIKGHFAPNQWVNDDGELIHEIAINANWMLAQHIVELMHILGREMCHLWQEDFGNTSRLGYHNAEWALLAERIGLEPQPGSKLMGDKVGTQVKPGGPLERAISTMPDEAVFPWLAAAAKVATEKPSEAAVLAVPVQGSAPSIPVRNAA